MVVPVSSLCLKCLVRSSGITQRCWSRQSFFFFQLTSVCRDLSALRSCPTSGVLIWAPQSLGSPQVWGGHLCGHSFFFVLVLSPSPGKQWPAGCGGLTASLAVLAVCRHDAAVEQVSLIVPEQESHSDSDRVDSAVFVHSAHLYEFNVWLFKWRMKGFVLFPSLKHLNIMQLPHMESDLHFVFVHPCS